LKHTVHQQNAAEAVTQLYDLFFLLGFTTRLLDATVNFVSTIINQEQLL